MIGIWALAAYLAVILLWTTLLKRSVGEAIMTAAQEAISKDPTPNPSPQGGGEPAATSGDGRVP